MSSQIQMDDAKVKGSHKKKLLTLTTVLSRHRSNATSTTATTATSAERTTTTNDKDNDNPICRQGREIICGQRRRSHTQHSTNTQQPTEQQHRPMHRPMNNSPLTLQRSSIDMAYSLCSSHDNARQQRDDEQNNNLDDDDSSSNNGFLEHLHQLLDEHSIGSCGQRIVSWNSDGLSFQIHDPQKFQSLLMPLYFSNIEYKYRYPLLSGYDAFLKRLRNFGFHRIENDGIYKDTFSHPLFVRGKPKLALRMSGLVAKQHQQSLQLRRNSWPMPPLTLAKGLFRGRSKSTTSTRTSSVGTWATNTRPLFSGLSGLQLKLAKGMIPRKSGQSIDKPFVFRQALQRRKRPVVPEKNHSLGGNSSLGIVSLDSIGNSFGPDNNSSHQNQFQHGQQQQNNNNNNNNINNNNANEATAPSNAGFLDIFLDLTEQDYQEPQQQQQPQTAAIHVPQNLPQTQSQSHSQSQIQPQTHYHLDDSDDRARMAAFNALDDDELERELHPTIRTIDVEPLDLYFCTQEDGFLDDDDIADVLSTL